MVLLNTSELNATFTILGGFIAGLVGLIASYWLFKKERKALRSDLHRQDHLENIVAIERLISLVRWVLFPGIVREIKDEAHLIAETLDCGSKVKLSIWSHLDLASPSIIFASEETRSLTTLAINQTLYSDMRFHRAFKQFDRTLVELNKELRTRGEDVEEVKNRVVKVTCAEFSKSPLGSAYNDRLPVWFLTASMALSEGKSSVAEGILELAKEYGIDTKGVMHYVKLASEELIKTNFSTWPLAFI